MASVLTTATATAIAVKAEDEAHGVEVHLGVGLLALGLGGVRGGRGEDGEPREVPQRGGRFATGRSVPTSRVAAHRTAKTGP
ncbi:hypothetical protein ACGH7X_21935 [Streptomyces sp. BBFR51]|uniref:hypothetical protein n=1 Tax=Streptomyces sp. BBFR51 TaxID=3372856 RepID=UPI0037DC1D5D